MAKHSYGASNQRLLSEENGLRTWFAWGGGATLAEYGETAGSLSWTRSYVYLGGRLLGSEVPTGVSYHHADRLGTRLTTNTASGVESEQAHLPFGTALAAESSGVATNRRFTSYDRSGTTQLDYAVNRFYAAGLGRFTQVDPIGMGAVSLGDPQSLNLYSYVYGDPISFVDPDGGIPIAVAIIGVSALVGGAIDAYRCRGCTAWERTKAFGRGALVGAFGGAAAVLGAATGTVLGAAVFGAVGGAGSTLISNGLKNGRLTSNDFVQAGTSGAVGFALGGVSQYLANQLLPASRYYYPSGVAVVPLSSNRFSSSASVFADNLFRLSTQGGSRTYRETANNVIPNTITAILQPIVQPPVDSVILPLGGGDGLGSGIINPLPTGGGRSPFDFLLAGGGGGSQSLGCYDYGDYRVCVTFTEEPK
jgi:RHS repeat-associated protein